MEKIETIESELEKLKIKARGLDWNSPRIQKSLTECANTLFDLIGGESCHFFISPKRSMPVAYEFSISRKIQSKKPATDRELFNKVISSFMGKDKSSSVGWVRLTYDKDNELSFLSSDKKRLSDLALVIGFVIQDALISSGETIKAECNQLAMIFAFIKILEAKGKWTYGHSVTVANIGITLLTAALGNEEWVSQIDQEEINELEKWLKFGGLLHDIGKIGVNDAILDKPEKLTKDEFDKVKIHTGIGGSLLEILGLECTKTIIPIIKHHHENFDGTGYPDGLKGNEIPFGARIIKIADVFCALSEERPYRVGLSFSVAMKEIMNQKGKMFDPILSDIFCRLPFKYLVEEDISSHIETEKKTDIMPGGKNDKVISII